MSDILLNPDGVPNAPSSPGSDPVMEGSTATFMQDVIEPSSQIPVIVDFWATWCGPCKTLGPMLEKRVREMNGAVRLVKIDIDKNQDLAAQLRIQSVPTVYAFKDGQPIDGFQGAVSESQIKQFIQKITGDAKSPIEDALAQAKELFDAGDTVSAKQIYTQVLQHQPDSADAIGGMLKVMIADGELDEARTTVDRLPNEIKSHAEVTSAVAALELAEQAGDAAGELADVQARVDANPEDCQARYDLALAAQSAGQSEIAVNELLEIVRMNRAWNDDAARLQLLKIFEALGFSDPIAVDGRKRLSTLLFS